MDPSLQKLLATGGNTVLVFGPQVAVFDSKFIEHVRAGLAEGPDFLRHTISSLPEYWDGLVAELPEIEQTIPGKEHVQTLIHCLEHGLDQEIRRAPNMIVSPIAVIEEFLQYWRFLQMIHGNEGEATSDGKTDLQAWWLARQQNSKTATLGFCGGLFASFAVASSHTWEELEQNVAAMVRLSMVTSAMVDAYEVWDGRSESFAAICRQEQQGEQMRGILEELASDAHVQATFDVGCATLCVSQEQAPVLLDRLRAVGVKTSRLGIHGRAHHPGDQGRRSVAVLTKLCESMPGLRLPDASQVSMPTYNGATPISEGGLHEMAVRGILSQPCHWYRTFMAVHAQLDTPLVVSFGEECVPRSMVSGIRSTFLSMKALQRAKSRPAAPTAPAAPASADIAASPVAAPIATETTPSPPPPNPSSAHSEGTSNAEIPSFETVAIVGMAIKTAGADDIDEFASLLRSGQSQHERVRAERIPLDTSREWYANMMQDTDAFDHKFFKRSPRESATIDPQQRLFLQTVYQALEDAGYFATKTRTGSSPSNVGVFAGSTMNDYEHHTVGHSPGAFTGTATKSYIPARVAHFFGWTGPTIVYDTTCSSSMVALHAACRSLLSGECAAAVAGGVNIMTHPHTFRALAAGNFISPTGQCKPFDQAADGYCRAEAVGCVYLKRMSDAVRDGDRVIGAISSTAVLQNLNTTPFFVPNSPSLSQLLSTILDQAKMDPAAISVMEAHGTGTTVGDAAEYESIRQVVAGPKRARPLILGSVKGHVGHAEGTSGVVSLIKILAMMQENFIPPQASFSTLSSHLNATPTDMIEVSTALRKWPSGSRAAVISNYGATGSIAAMVVTKPPPRSEVSSLEHSHAGNLVPLWIAGLDERSISAYCVRLLRYLQSHPTAALSDIAFNVNQSSNRALPQRALLCCRSRKELEERLAQLASRTHTKTGEANPQITIAPKERPLILCFGGQAGQSIGLDRTLYENVTLLRDHLDQCDVAIQAAGAGSIYPGIFSREPIADQVHLQVMLFAMQYACARSWLDTGVLSRTVAVVGHSFGEITALCISGTLTLQETVQLLIARAKLVRDEWGNDSGAMLTINAEESTVTQILAEANVRYTGAHPASIACYNGPLQFTLGGSSEAIDAVQAVCDEQQPTIKTRRLAVTNAFHTSLVDPLCNRLAELNQRVSWKKPVIRQERATESPVDTPFHFAEHMRHPVYFRQAIQRLAEEHPSAVWLEAGSASGVTTMASGTLKTAAGPHSFHSLNVTDGRGGLDGLVTTTMSLWTEGIPVTFWGHHPVQASTVALRSLPPYQFEKSRHWLELKLPQDLASASSGSPERKEAQGLADLIKFVGNREETDSKNSIGGSYSRPYFAIDTSARLYSELLNGHVLNRTTPVLPVGVQIGLAFHALLSLRPQWVTDRMQPMVQDMINHAFICDDPSRKLWLEFHVKDEKQLTWDWAIVSTDGAELPHTRLMHVEARMQMYHPYDVAYQAEFRLLQTLASYKECSALFAHANTSSDADEGADEIQIAQGSTVYHLMDKVVQYGEPYRWLKRVVSRGSSAAGCVRKRKVDLASAFDVGLVDAFCQVGSIAINCMNDTVHPDDVWVHRGCNRWIRSPNVSTVRETSHVLVRHRHISDRLREMDVFVFDPTTGALVEAMLGARAVQFPKAALSDILTRLNADQPVSQSTAQVAHRRAAPVKDQGPQVVVQSDQDSAAEGRRGFEHTLEDVRVMVAKLLGVNENEVAPQSQLADLGIDSLMSVELGSDIETTFKCLPDEADMMEATSVEELALCIWNTLRGDDTAGSEKSEETLIVEKVGDGENVNLSGKLLIDSDLQIPAKLASIVATDIDIQLAQSDILDNFNTVKMNSDQRIRDAGLENSYHTAVSLTNRLSVALVVEAFEQLGCDLRTASPGDRLQSVKSSYVRPETLRSLHDFIANTARLVDVDAADEVLVRTAIPVHPKTSDALLQELMRKHPEHSAHLKLTFQAGKHLAEVLQGTAAGDHPLSNASEGHALVHEMHRDFLYNQVMYQTVSDSIRSMLDRLRAKTGTNTPPGTLRILEMGGGAGDLTRVLASMLAAQGVPIEYTFTDPSSSRVAMASAELGKQYPFMNFAVHDIENSPAENLQGQHIVLAADATQSITASLEGIHQMLRPDGCLMILEKRPPFLDTIYGPLEGGWLFDDSSDYSLVPTEQWKRDLQTAGFQHVDWTDGSLPEQEGFKVILALASGPIQEVCPISTVPRAGTKPGEIMQRQERAQELVSKYTSGFTAPIPAPVNDSPGGECKKSVVIVTGGTGNLGSHVAALLSQSPAVETVVCLNRRARGVPAMTRQHDAFSSRGIELSQDALDKLRVLESTTTDAQLGLLDEDYQWLVTNGTDIIHCAFPLSPTQTVRGLEPQFQAMRHLLDLAHSMACQPRTERSSRVGFQMISSVSVVGYSEETPVREELRGMEGTQAMGYSEAKWVCEHILEATLRQYPEHFRAMTVRIGQIGGSTTSGFWTCAEHVPFLIKSAQTLRAWPDLGGHVSWVAVDQIATILMDLLAVGVKHDVPTPNSVYHIEHPMARTWKEMAPVMAAALNIPASRIIPVKEWVALVRNSPLERSDNPAILFASFFESAYESLMCGRVLDTTWTQAHSPAMAKLEPIGDEMVGLYIDAWKKLGFLGSQ